MELWRNEFYASDYGYQYLMHHGIKGQKWGIRRFQNPDGSLTKEGKKRYYVNSEGNIEKIPTGAKLNKEYREAQKQYENSDEAKYWREQQKKAEKRAFEIADKYGLDADDGGGGDTEKFSEKQLEKASFEYMNAWDDYEQYEQHYRDGGKAYADKCLSGKYGKYSLNKMKAHNTNVGIAVVAGILATPFALMGTAMALDGH